MSLIETLRPCDCGQCDAYTHAARGAKRMQSNAFWLGGMRSRAANELAEVVAFGCLFWIGTERFERWTA